MATSMPNARLAFDKGQAFFEQRKWDEALAAFRAAVAKDPAMSEGWYQIGMADMLKNGGRPCEAAYAPFRLCADLDADNARALCGLGDVLRHVRDDLPRAEEHFQHAIRLDPNFAPAHRGLAGVLERRDALDEAIREMLEYVRLSGDHDGSGKAHAAALLEKKAGRAAKPDAEAQARSPPPLVAPVPRLRATSCG